MENAEVLLPGQGCLLLGSRDLLGCLQQGHTHGMRCCCQERVPPCAGEAWPQAEVLLPSPSGLLLGSRVCLATCRRDVGKT